MTLANIKSRIGEPYANDIHFPGQRCHLHWTHCYTNFISRGRLVNRSNSTKPR